MTNSHTLRSLFALTLAFMGAGAALAQHALPVNAQDAARAIERGAVVLDVRSAQPYAQGHLPTAVSAPEALALYQRGSFSALAVDQRHALAALVSQRGADLSREVLVVGEPGDERAMAFAAQLAQHASGRISWLVGGVSEWQMTGRALSQQAHQLPAVPQFLTRLQPVPQQPRMAGQSLRYVALGTDFDVKTADSRR